MLLKLCFCRERQVDLKRATYTVSGTPCCGRDCYEEALEAQGVDIDHIIVVAYNTAAAAVTTL